MTGLLPYSRMTQYRGTGQAVLPTRGLTLHKKLFPELLQRIPELGQRFVALLADRIRETTRVETQRDKMAALGKLSAGVPGLSARTISSKPSYPRSLPEGFLASMMPSVYRRSVSPACR